MRFRVLALAAALLGVGLLPDCAGKSSRDGAPAPAPSARAPMDHRPSASLCPAQRPAVSTTPKSGCSESDVVTECLLDSECPAAHNGRCVFPPIFACVSSCQQDDCYADSDCPQNQPCVCRKDASDPQANYCSALSNCRVDADCGAGGYCSPSLLEGFCTCLNPAYCDVPCDGCACGDSCGHGYFCHTARDGCLDDTDCESGQYCAFDKVEQRFFCQGCVVIP